MQIETIVSGRRSDVSSPKETQAKAPVSGMPEAASSTPNVPLSRRAVLRGGGALALGVSGSGLLADVALAQPDRRRRRLAGGEIRVSIMDFTHETLQPVIDAFTKKTGTTVKLSPTSPFGQMAAKYAPQFESETTPFDLMTIPQDLTQTFGRAGWLSPLSMPRSYTNDVGAAMADNIKVWGTHKSNVYGVPNIWDTAFYFIRADLLNQMSVRAPATWNDMVTFGKEAKKRFGTYAFGDGSDAGHVVFTVMWLAMQAGGNIFKLDSGTTQALNFLKSLQDQGLFPKQALAWDYDESNASYMSDRLLTMRQWTYFYDVSRGNKKWFKPAKAQIILPPKGPVRRATYADASHWAIPKFTPQPEAAKAFLDYITSPEVAPTLARGQSVFLLPRKSVFRALGKQGVAPAFASYDKAKVMQSRPYHPSGQQGLNVLSSAFHGYLTGQVSMEGAYKRAKSELDRLSRR
jgi:multiple sugar transport system substrate-binding protein